MTRKKRGGILFAVVILIVVLSCPSFAAGPLYKTTRASKMTNKLLRGLLNIPMCVMEIPKALNKNIKNTDYFTGTFTGLGEGIFKSSKRLVYGTFEVVTFPQPEWKVFDSWVDHPIPFKELAE